MAKLDFCANCNRWIAANSGHMREGPDGEAEIICDECHRLEQKVEVKQIAPGMTLFRPAAKKGGE